MSGPGRESGRPARLGFVVQVLGRPGLRSHDARRWQNNPHLSVSLDYLREILAYLDEEELRFYRISSELVPYATHPDHPQFHGQVDECRARLAELGAIARRLDLRLSFHPAQYIVLNTPDDELAARSAADIEVQAAILEAMGLGDEAVVVIHVGGVYSDRQAALVRFARRYAGLSPAARRRLVVENDDGRFAVNDLLWLHQEIGVRLVFDAHHHYYHNPERIDTHEAARACLATWRGWDGRPKVHFSSPRTDWGYRYGSDQVPQSPDWKAHAEFVDPFAFISFYRSLLPDAPDVMLEAKAKDVALKQLQRDLVRFAPDVATIFGLGR